VTQPMLSRLGPGGMYTLLAGICIFTSVPLIFIERRNGMKWRQQREENLKLKREKQQQRAEIQQVEEVNELDVTPQPQPEKAEQVKS
jgi:hypothetical protein